VLAEQVEQRRRIPARSALNRTRKASLNCRFTNRRREPIPLGCRQTGVHAASALVHAISELDGYLQVAVPW
jgi:hypothetical protein